MGGMSDLIGYHGAANAGMLGPAFHAGLEEGAVDDQLTAAVDAQRPARHERGSTPSPSRAVAGAQPPTPAVTRFWGDSFRSLPIRVPSVLVSFCFPLVWFVFFFLQNLLIIKAVIPPLDVAPAAIKAA